MLSKPICLAPNISNESAVVDATKRCKFVSIPYGNEGIVKVILKIYDAQTNVLKNAWHFSNINESNPFFPVGNKNQNKTLTMPLSSIEVSAKNRKEPYYWICEFTGSLGSVVTSHETVFYANSTPVLTITFSESNADYSDLTADSILNSRKCFFKATYEQAEGVPIKKYGWRLKNYSNEQVLIDTISQNNIYGTSDNISCEFDGFLNNYEYTIELFVETQNGFCITTDPIKFFVKYEEILLSSEFNVSTLRAEPSVFISWEDMAAIQGKVIGNYEFKNNYPVVSSNSIGLTSKNSKIVYDTDTNTNIDIDEESYITLSTQIYPLSNSDTVNLIKLTGQDNEGNETSRTLLYTNGDIKYTVQCGDYVYTQAYKVANKPSRYVWYIILMSPILENDSGEKYVFINVAESKKINGLYPSKTLLPSSKNKIYPSFGTWDKIKESE